VASGSHTTGTLGMRRALSSSAVPAGNVAGSSKNEEWAWPTTAGSTLQATVFSPSPPNRPGREQAAAGQLLGAVHRHIDVDRTVPGPVGHADVLVGLLELEPGPVVLGRVEPPAQGDVALHALSVPRAQGALALFAAFYDIQVEDSVEALAVGEGSVEEC
jgi:hypothetical protein